MKIKIGEVIIELEPDLSAKEVQEAKDERARWWQLYENLSERYNELARMVRNAELGKYLDCPIPDIGSFTHESHVRSATALSKDRNESNRKYAELVEAVARRCPNASHEYVVTLAQKQAMKWSRSTKRR